MMTRVADERGASGRRRRPIEQLAADAHARTDHGVGGDDRTGADLGAGSDHGARIDGHPILEPRPSRASVAPGDNALGAEQRGGTLSGGKQRARATATNAR